MWGPSYRKITPTPFTLTLYLYWFVLTKGIRAVGEKLNTLFYFNPDRTPAERLAFQEYAAIARLEVKKICCADELNAQE